MLPEGKCRYIDGQIYPDGNFYVLDTQHIKHNGSELKSALNGISTDISNKVDKETGKGLSTNDYTTAEKNKLSGIEANANNYVHPTTSGNKHIPSGGSSGKILGWSADGTAAWVDPASGGGGSVDTVYIGSTEYAPDANGKVTLPTYPTTLPASDVYSWAKASTKPSYTQDEVTDGTTYKRVTSTEKTTWNNKGTYSKPSGGIPKTDLASAVQTSLGKADTALQSFTETDPTVPSWAKASSKPSYTASEVGAIATTAKGAANGVAELDANGKVPSAQLPSYVDDVLEYSAKSSFPATGETGKIYVDTSTNLTYRWSGSAYTEISPSLALGETSSTAYRGDRGKKAYTHATDSSRLTTATASGLYKVASTAQGHIASLTAVVKSDITELGIPAQDTTYSVATISANGLMSSTDKSKLDGIATGAQVNSITGVKGNSESSYRTGNVNLTAANIGAAASSHTHKYAGSSSAGGAATSANKLNVGSSNIGSATQPVYFDASTGLPVATTYSLAKSVPSDAKFTDTTYSVATQSANGLMSANDKCLMYQLIALDNLSSVSVSAPLYSRAQYSDIYTIFPRTVYVTKTQLGISNSNVIAAAKVTSDDSRVPGVSAVTIDNANNRIGVTFTETLYADIRVTFVVAYN